MMELWPFTNFHDLNLDWIIKKIRSVEDSEAAAKASEEAAADSASAAAGSAGMALIYRGNAKDFRDEAQGFANDAQDSADSIAGVVNQVNSNTGRIDNLVANAGDTDNNAELLDIRVAYDGTTYATAGDAVRGQAENVKDDTMDIAKVLGVYPYDPRHINMSMIAIFENKTISVVDGTTETASNKFISSVYFECEPTKNIYLGVTTGYKASLLCYDSAHTYLGRYGGVFFDTDQVIDLSASTTYANTKYIRMIITKVDNTDLIPAESNTIHYYNDELPTEWQNYVEEVKYTENLITKVEAGYVDDPSGVVVLGANGEKTSEYITCVPGELLTFQAWVEVPSGSAVWYAASFYDSAKAFISRAGRTIVSEVVDGVSHFLYTFTAPASAAYVRFSYRSYMNGKAMATRTKYIPEYSAPISEPILFPPKFNEFIKGIAHRGGYYGPENTLPAYKTANSEYGFTYVEADVCMTSDDIPVLLHDDTIDRTSNGTGAINSMTYQQALQYDFGSWKGVQFTGTKIPTLEELLILCRNIKLKPYLELKQSANLTDAQIKIIVDLVKKWNMQYETTFIAFAPSYLKTVLKYMPYARIGQLMNNDSYTSNYHKQFADLDNGVCNMFFDIDSTVYTDAAKLSELASYGYPIEIWTLNNADAMKALPDIISGVTSDDVNFETVIEERDTTL